VTTRLTSKFDALRALAVSKKLRKRDYRKALIDAEIRHGITDQIRAMRERRGWTQKDLAERIGTSQPAVARMERTRDKYLSLPTLLSVADAFDVGLLLRFVPFSEVVRRSLDHSEFEQAPLSFDEEVRFVTEERVPSPAATARSFAEAVPQATTVEEIRQDAPPSDDRYQPVA
jgi:transcriptional regulator with XRE-family HTH domain